MRFAFLVLSLNFTLDTNFTCRELRFVVGVGYLSCSLCSKGGCCDCGDEQAWDVKSFCSNHRDRPISEHEKMVFASLVPALNEIGLCLKKTLSGFPDSRDSFVNLMRFFTALPVIFGGTREEKLLNGFV